MYFEYKFQQERNRFQTTGCHVYTYRFDNHVPNGKLV